MLVNFKNKNLALCLLVLTWGCKTTEEIQREKLVDHLSVQSVQMKQQGAEVHERIQNLEEQIAILTGKAEETQHKSDLYQQELEKMHQRVVELEEKNKEYGLIVNNLQQRVTDQNAFITNVTKTLEKLAKEPAKKKKNNGPIIYKGIQKNYDEGITLYRQGKYTQSKPYLVTLYENDKVKGNTRAHVLHNLGMVSFIQKKYSEALVYFSQLYTQFPKSGYSSNGLLYLGKSFQKTGKVTEAKDSFTELISKFPKSKSAATAKKELKKL